MARTQIMVPLSKLVTSRHNVRRVKPERDAHRKLVASIRAHGLIVPLLVKPAEDDTYIVIAGNRRLSALREVHRGEDPTIPCMVRDVDDGQVEALGLSENFIREPMHPIDEACTFASLAQQQGKNADAIAADFGTTPTYIRQRMRLATLDDTIKAAYRNNQIDTATAEAFAAVPPERQLEIWQEIGGTPRHAEQVKRIIASSWIDAKHALFDVTRLPENAVTADLFSERVLVERSVFLAAQAEALATQRQVLEDEGWSQVIIGSRADVQDQLYAMTTPPPTYDESTTDALARLNQKRQKLEAKLEQLQDGDEAGLNRIQEKLDELDQEENRVTESAKLVYPDAIKAVGTVFLLIDPEGQVRTEYRIPSSRRGMQSGDSSVSSSEEAAVLTSDELSERQTAELLVHRTLAVRQAALTDRLVCKRLTVLILHDHVRIEALAIKHERNAVSEQVTKPLTQESPVQSHVAVDIMAQLVQKQSEVDSFYTDDPVAERIDEATAYQRLKDLSEAQLDDLIAILTVQMVSASLVSLTPLIEQLATELNVQQRATWMPMASWLNGYKKPQLTHLMQELLGPIHTHGADQKKKSELVGRLAKVFVDAADGHIADADVAAKLNAWLPAILRPQDVPIASAEAA